MSSDNLCASIKSKKEINIRCTNKKKNGCDFCGKHQNNPIYFKNLNEEKKEEILSVSKLFNFIEEKKNISVLEIRKAIKNSYLKNFINSKLSKINLISNIKNQIIKERYYLNHEESILKIQSIIRMFLKKYRYKCSNDVDILTMVSKMDIEYPYFYRFYNKINKKYYAYDIRLLNNLINSDYKSCPYTFRDFNEEELNSINMYINYLEKNNISIKIVSELNEDEIIENKVKDLFYKINMLDNYTNHKWFLDLNLIELIKLYISAEDIWNYRSLLTQTSKYNIIGNNYIFNYPVFSIKKIKSINKLRNILIDTFNIMISNGIDINEKKLGAILVLSALVEISPDAANALPHLVQV